MKVSSAPFEAPTGTNPRGTASDGLARASSEKASAHLVSAPTGGSSVKAGLDAATKDALLRLANLAKEKESEKQKEKRKSNSRTAAKVISKNDVVAMEAVKEFTPNVASQVSNKVLDRVKSHFEAARMQFGRQVYREAVKRQAIVELEKEFNLDLNIEELQSLSDMPDAVTTEDGFGPTGARLKRVA